MIGEVAARVGSPVVIKGRSYDFGRAVKGVQFSLNEGDSWTTYPLEGMNDYQLVDWSFEFLLPQPGEYRLLVRSVNAEGTVSPEPAYATVRVAE